jgi:hypothetical protein
LNYFRTHFREMTEMRNQSPETPALLFRYSSRKPHTFFLILCWFVATTTFPAHVAFAAKTENVAEPTEDSNVARLPPLPTPPSTVPPLPSNEETEELEGKFKGLKSPSSRERTEAVKESLEVRPKLIFAAIARFNKLSERAEPERLKRALVSIKEKANRGRRGSTDESKDLVYILAEQCNVKDDSHRELLELVTLSRVFAQIGTVEGARYLIEEYVRFGEFVRVDVQNRLFELKDGAIAALIEARRHKAEKIAHWAERQLDRLGKAAPSEAVRTTSYQTLADILRAYGRTKDPDAARVVVSYANSERYQVREAARQAVALMGNVALWQLREAYEDVMGKRPRRDFGWERTARELFYEYDRLRIVVVAKLYESGVKAYGDGNLEEMAKAYDAVLARLPEFDRGPDMAAGYFALAEKLQHKNPEEAASALVRVERLAKDENLRARARSLRDTLKAVKRAENGVFDTSLLSSAVERDRTNVVASKMLTALDKQLVESTTTRVRWLTSGAIAMIALISIAIILFRRRPNPTNVNQLLVKDDSPSPSNPLPQRVVGHAEAPIASPNETLRNTLSTVGSEFLKTTSTDTPPRTEGASSTEGTPSTESASSTEGSLPPPIPKRDPFEGL